MPARVTYFAPVAAMDALHRAAADLLAASHDLNEVEDGTRLCGDLSMLVGGLYQTVAAVVDLHAPSLGSPEVE